MWSSAISSWKAAQNTTKPNDADAEHERTQTGRDLGARLQYEARADDRRDAAAGADDRGLREREAFSDERQRGEHRERGRIQQPWRALLDAVAERRQEVDVAQQVKPAGVREAGLQRRPHARMFRTVGEPRDRRVEPVAALLRDEHGDQHAHQRPGDDGQAHALRAHHHGQAAQRQQLVHQPQLRILRRRRRRDIARHLGPLRRREAGERELARYPLLLLVQRLQRPARAQPSGTRRAAVHHDLRFGQFPRHQGRRALGTGERLAVRRGVLDGRHAPERLWRTRREILLRTPPRPAPPARTLAPQVHSVDRTAQRRAHRSPVPASTAPASTAASPARAPTPRPRRRTPRAVQLRRRRLAPGWRARPGRRRGSLASRRRPDLGACSRWPCASRIFGVVAPARGADPLRAGLTGPPEAIPDGGAARQARRAIRRVVRELHQHPLRAAVAARATEHQRDQLQHVGRGRILARAAVRPAERARLIVEHRRATPPPGKEPRRQRRARRAPRRPAARRAGPRGGRPGPARRSTRAAVRR